MNAVNIAVKVRTVFQWKWPHGKFQCAKMHRCWSFYGLKVLWCCTFLQHSDNTKHSPRYWKC